MNFIRRSLSRRTLSRQSAKVFQDGRLAFDIGLGLGDYKTFRGFGVLGDIGVGLSLRVFHKGPSYVYTIREHCGDYKTCPGKVRGTGRLRSCPTPAGIVRGRCREDPAAIRSPPGPSGNYGCNRLITVAIISLWSSSRSRYPSGGCPCIPARTACRGPRSTFWKSSPVCPGLPPCVAERRCPLPLASFHGIVSRRGWPGWA